MNILNRINILDTEKWMYKDSDFDFTFNPHKFSSQYLDYSDKEKLKSILPESQSRLPHAFSTFFIGILIYNNTDLYNSPNLKGYSNKYGKFRLFPFIWFITSILHDTYFDDEMNNIKSQDVKLEDRIKLLSKNTNNVPKYLSSSIEKYYSYRLKNDKYDHGIIAGVNLLFKLCSIRDENKNNSKFWEKKLIKYYFQASQVIAVHNIWLPQENDIVKYQAAGLYELIKNKNTKISYKQFPLLFLLGLVDTIDPVKLYDCVAPEFVLRNVDISMELTSVKITISRRTKLNLSKLFKLESKLNWLKIRFDKGSNFIIIHFLE